MSAYQKALGNYISTFEWNFFATLTFSKPVSIPGAVRRVEEYLSWHPPAFAFYAIEKKPYSEVHCHALIGRVSSLIPWKLGRSEISPYDRMKGGAWYASKQTLEWNMFGGFPKPKPPGASKWWRPGTTLDSSKIDGGW